MVTEFRQLRCYQLAFQQAMELCEVSKDWPPEERFGLTTQIRNSSRAVCGAIAEAWGKRRYPEHFVSKLTDADSECQETQNWLDFAPSCNYISMERHDASMQDYAQVSGSLVKMMSDPKAWCGPAKLRGQASYRRKPPTMDV